MIKVIMEEKIKNNVIFDRLHSYSCLDSFYNVSICKSDLMEDEEKKEIERKVYIEINLCDLCNAAFKKNLYYYLRYMLGDDIAKKCDFGYEINYPFSNWTYNIASIRDIICFLENENDLFNEYENCLYYDIYNIMYYSAEEVVKRYKREGLKIFMENFKTDESWR